MPKFIINFSTVVNIDLLAPNEFPYFSEVFSASILERKMEKHAKNCNYFKKAYFLKNIFHKRFEENS